MISYFELLKMIKENNIPNKIRVNLTPGSSRVYVRENDLEDTFNFYHLKNAKEGNENYSYYLSESFLESTMFDKNIEILDKKGIEKITINDNGTIGFPNGEWTARNMDKAFAIKINQIIDKIDEMNNK